MMGPNYKDKKEYIWNGIGEKLGEEVKCKKEV